MGGSALEGPHSVPGGPRESSLSTGGRGKLCSKTQIMTSELVQLIQASQAEVAGSLGSGELGLMIAFPGSGLSRL